jgi:hypothetical protein
MSAAVGAAGSSALAVHGWHALEAVGFFVVSLTAVAVGEWSRRRRSVHAPRQSGIWQPRLLDGMFVAGAGAAAVHYVVMPTHFAESTLYGAFFLLAATTQLGYSSLLVFRPSRALVAVGMLGNAAMVALWLTTRLVAIPLGPAAGSREGFGGLDILASCFEVAIVLLGALVLLRAGDPDARAARRELRKPMTIGFALLAMVAVTATACAAPPS